MIAVNIVTTLFYRQCIYDLHMTLTISSYCVQMTINHRGFIMRWGLTDFFYII